MLDVSVSDMRVEPSPVRPDYATASLIMPLICGAISVLTAVDSIQRNRQSPNSLVVIFSCGVSNPFYSGEFTALLDR
ncbi:hypothetical protein PEB0150_015170 [Bartonella apis]|nr:hypothetical protein PEB0150_015170 [Bartonella apis]